MRTEQVQKRTCGERLNEGRMSTEGSSGESMNDDRMSTEENQRRESE